jgi:hypothetical protein
VVVGYRALLSLKDYIFLNQLEGCGYRRDVARRFLFQHKGISSSA